MKKLKLWNGRWLGIENKYVYICAYSRADAIRLICEYRGYKPKGIYSEVRDYFNEGCWGNSMNGITPERGLWIKKNLEKPVRVI